MSSRRSNHPRWTYWGGGLILLCNANSGHAQDVTDSALAEALYQEAKSLMKAGQFDAACPKFAESQRLDPGLGTLLNLANCHEKVGKIASAWAEYKTALAQAEQNEQSVRANYARERIQELEPLLSRVTVTVHDEARVDGFEVRLDGVVIREAAWGVPMPIDPGTHELIASAPNRISFKTAFELRGQGDLYEVTIPGLDTRQTEVAPLADSDQESPSSGLRTGGFIALGVGVVGLGAAGYFGFRAFSRWGDRQDECDSSGCSQQGLRFEDQAKDSARNANIAGAIGLISLGVGSYLILSNPPPSKEADEARASRTSGEENYSLKIIPRIGSRGAGVSLGGVF